MLETKDYVFKMENYDDEIGTFSGYASTKSRDMAGEIIKPNAYKKTLQENPEVPILYWHDPQRPVGISRKMIVDNKGLYTEGQIDLNTELGRMVYSGMKNGYLDSLSVGLRVINRDKKERNVITEAQLKEYSIITKGYQANKDSFVQRVKQEEIDIERIVRNLMEEHPLISEMNLKMNRLEELLAEPLDSTRPLLCPEPGNPTFGTKQEDAHTAQILDVIRNFKNELTR